MRIAEYLDASGKNSFAGWFDDLDAQAAVKIMVALTRIAQGNFSNVKGVGSGVAEYRIDYGPGDEVVILLAGGTKRRQQADIRSAVERWQDSRDARRAAKMALTRDF